jgi:hypothetical protein
MNIKLLKSFLTELESYEESAHRKEYSYQARNIRHLFPNENTVITF